MRQAGQDYDTYYRRHQPLLPSEKLPPLPLALVSCNGEALTKEQTLLAYCVNCSISQSSRLKFNWKFFVINEEYLKGVHDFKL